MSYTYDNSIKQDWENSPKLRALFDNYHSYCTWTGKHMDELPFGYCTQDIINLRLSTRSAGKKDAGKRPNHENNKVVSKGHVGVPLTSTKKVLGDMNREIYRYNMDMDIHIHTIPKTKTLLIGKKRIVEAKETSTNQKNTGVGSNANS
jgi:hypothetical protein